MIEKEKRKELYRNCDPFKNEEKFLVKIDDYYDDETLIRGYNWSKKLFKKIDFGEGDTVQLFTGYSGSGKTTVLKKIQKQLDEEDYLCVYISAEEYIDINKELDISDIYNSILYSVVVEVNKLFEDNDSFSDEGYFSRLTNFLNSEVDIKNFKIGDIVLELKDKPTLRQQVAQYINDNFSAFKKDIKIDLAKLNEKVKKKRKKGIVVIFDSLEKNKGTTQNYNDVIANAEIIFSNKENLQMPFDIIYTVPSFLSERIRLIDIDFLPAIKIKNLKNKKFDKGIELLKILIEKRIPEKYLKEILGDDYKKKIEKIIMFSGGYVRGLLNIIRTILLEDNYPVKDKFIDKILNNETNTFLELIDSNTKEYLKKVYKDKSISDIDDIKIKDKFLTNYLILRYRNDDLWFDIHPAVKDIINNK